MKIFISWSGEASRRIAEEFRTSFFPIFFQDCKFFMSKHDIGSGARWGAELAAELDQSNFGIVCLTTDNLAAPWILFEAGALTKHIDGRACCLLFGGLTPASVTEPLSQFQNKVFSEEDFRHLLRDINRLRDSPMELAAFDKLFDKFWPDISREVDDVLKEHSQEAAAPRPGEEILEEILLRVRAMESKLSTETSSKFPAWAEGARQVLGGSIAGENPFVFVPSGINAATHQRENLWEDGDLDLLDAGKALRALYNIAEGINAATLQDKYGASVVQWLRKKEYIEDGPAGTIRLTNTGQSLIKDLMARRARNTAP